MKNLILFGLALAACGGTARGLEAYRTDTQHTLDTRTAQLSSCYDDALKTDATLAGTVTVQFVVAKESGAFGAASIVADKSTAGKPLGDCVLRAVEGLQLAPGDRDEGHATFVYEFKPNTPVTATPTT